MSGNDSDSTDAPVVCGSLFPFSQDIEQTYPIGLDRSEEWFRERAERLMDDSEGVLMLVGPPGCGKTMTAEAIAADLDGDEPGSAIYDDVALLGLSGFRRTTHDAGLAEAMRALRDCVRERATEADATVVVFDEIESVLHERGPAPGSAAWGLRRLQSLDNVLVVGEACYPAALSHGVRAMAEWVPVLPPSSPDELADIWRDVTAGQRNADELDFRALGEASVGFTPREIDMVRSRTVDNLVSDADFDPNNFPKLTTEIYLEKLQQTDPTTLDRYLSQLAEHPEERELDALEAFYREWADFFHADDGSGDRSAPTGERHEP